MPVSLEELSQRIQTRRDLPPPPARKALRKAAGVSLSEVAGIVGVTRQAVSLWEAGERTPRAANAAAYLEVLREIKRAVAAS